MCAVFRSISDSIDPVMMEFCIGFGLWCLKIGWNALDELTEETSIGLASEGPFKNAG